MLVDRKNKAVYMTGLRNGSTLMEEIKDLVGPDRLFRHQYPEDLIRMLTEDRSYKIYMPFRDPMVRFKSALAVNMHNRCGFDTEDTSYKVQDETFVMYKKMLKYLDQSIGNDHNIFNLTYYRPYHLFDIHTDHVLFKPLIYLAYGYDVHMIPFNKFSEHLYERFPEATDIIKKRGRPDSFNTSMFPHELVWNAYKEVFVDNEPDFFKYKIPDVRFQTFDLWMKPETEIFEMFIENYKNVNLMKTKCRGLIRKFIETRQYFNDPYSPKFAELGSLLPVIETFNKPNRDLQNYIQNYVIIRNQLRSLHRGVSVDDLPKPLFN